MTMFIFERQAWGTLGMNKASPSLASFMRWGFLGVISRFSSPLITCVSWSCEPAQ